LKAMPAGRPTLYRDEYVDEVVEFCAGGYSLTGFAGHIGVARQTISEWCSIYPEFSVAAKMAKAASAKWWEEKAHKVAAEGGPGGQATMVIFGLKNHAHEDYSDKQQLEHTGKDGGPIEHRVDAPAKETREEWIARQMGTTAGAAIGGDPSDVVR
jgi:hypothetical protein